MLRFLPIVVIAIVILLLLLLLFRLVSCGGGSGQSGEGTNTPSGSNQSSPTPPPVNEESKETSHDPPLQRQLSTVVQVTVLAGKAVRQPGHFYLVDDHPSPLSFEEVKQSLLKRRQTVPDKLTLQIQFLPDPEQAPPLHDPKVVQLANWARQEAGMDVTFPSNKQR